MIDATQIPFEVRRAMRIEWAKRNNSDGPDKHMTDLAVAMLNAWPGAQESGLTMGKYSTHIFILPLTQKENSDGK